MIAMKKRWTSWQLITARAIATHLLCNWNTVRCAKQFQRQAPIKDGGTTGNWSIQERSDIDPCWFSFSVRLSPFLMNSPCHRDYSTLDDVTLYHLQAVTNNMVYSILQVQPSNHTLPSPTSTRLCPILTEFANLNICAHSQWSG